MAGVDEIIMELQPLPAETQLARASAALRVRLALLRTKEESALPVALIDEIAPPNVPRYVAKQSDFQQIILPKFLKGPRGMMARQGVDGAWFKLNTNNEAWTEENMLGVIANIFRNPAHYTQNAEAADAAIRIVTAFRVTLSDLFPGLEDVITHLDIEDTLLGLQVAEYIKSVIDVQAMRLREIYAAPIALNGHIDAVNEANPVEVDGPAPAGAGAGVRIRVRGTPEQTRKIKPLTILAKMERASGKMGPFTLPYWLNEFESITNKDRMLVKVYDDVVRRTIKDAVIPSLAFGDPGLPPADAAEVERRYRAVVTARLKAHVTDDPKSLSQFITYLRQESEAYAENVRKEARARENIRRIKTTYTELVSRPVGTGGRAVLRFVKRVTVDVADAFVEAAEALNEASLAMGRSGALENETTGPRADEGFADEDAYDMDNVVDSEGRRNPYFPLYTLEGRGRHLCHPLDYYSGWVRGWSVRTNVVDTRVGFATPLWEWNGQNPVAGLPRILLRCIALLREIFGLYDATTNKYESGINDGPARVNVAAGRIDYPSWTKYNYKGKIVDVSAASRLRIREVDELITPENHFVHFGLKRLIGHSEATEAYRNLQTVVPLSAIPDLLDTYFKILTGAFSMTSPPEAVQFAMLSNAHGALLNTIEKLVDMTEPSSATSEHFTLVSEVGYHGINIGGWEAARPQFAPHGVPAEELAKLVANEVWEALHKDYAKFEERLFKRREDIRAKSDPVGPLTVIATHDWKVVMASAVSLSMLQPIVYQRFSSIALNKKIVAIKDMAKGILGLVDLLEPARELAQTLSISGPVGLGVFYTLKTPFITYVVDTVLEYAKASIRTMLQWAGLAHLIPTIDKIITTALFGYLFWTCVKLFVYPETVDPTMIIVLQAELFRIVARYIVWPILRYVLPRIPGAASVSKAAASFAVGFGNLVTALVDLLQFWAPNAVASLGSAARRVTESRVAKGAAGALAFVTGYGYGVNPLSSLHTEYLADVFEFNAAPMHSTLATVITAAIYNYFMGSNSYMDAVTTPTQNALANVPVIKQIQQWIVDWGMNFHPVVKLVVQAAVIARGGRLLEAFSIASSRVFGSNPAAALIAEVPRMRRTSYGALTTDIIAFDQSTPILFKNETRIEPCPPVLGISFGSCERIVPVSYDPLPVVGKLFNNLVGRVSTGIESNNTTLAEIYGSDQVARFSSQTYNFTNVEIAQGTVGALMRKRRFIEETAQRGFDFLFTGTSLNTALIRGYLTDNDLVFVEPDPQIITARDLKKWYDPISKRFASADFPAAMTVYKWLTSPVLLTQNEVNKFSSDMKDITAGQPSDISALAQSIYWLAKAQEATPPAGSLQDRLSITTLHASLVPFMYGAVITSAAYTSTSIFNLINKGMRTLGGLVFFTVVVTSFMGHADMAQIAAPPQRTHKYPPPARKRKLFQEIPDAPASLKDKVRAIAAKYDHSFWIYVAQYALHIPLMRVRLARLFVASTEHPFYCKVLSPSDNALLDNFFFPALLAAPPGDALLPVPFMSTKPFVDVNPRVDLEETRFLELAAAAAKNNMGIPDPSFAEQYMDLLDVYLVYTFAVMSTEEYDTFRGSKKTE